MQRVAQFITRWEWLIFLLILPPLLFPSGYWGFLLLVPLTLWTVRWVGTGRFLPRTPYDTAVLILALMMLVSLYAVFDIGLSFPKIAGVVMGIALFYGAVTYTRLRPDGPSPGGMWRVVGFVILAGVGMALVGLVGMRWMGVFAPLNRLNALLPDALSAIPGTVGGVVNANQLAGTLDWVTPLLVACTLGLLCSLWQRRSWLLLFLSVFFLGGMSLFTIFILVATQSRGGMLGLVAALLVMLAIRFRWGKWVLVTAVILVVALAFYFNLGAALLDSEATINDFGLQGRLEIWSRALYGLADFPLTGMSMNGFRRVVHVLYPLFLISPDTDIAHAHNHLLQAGLDLGLLGLAAYLALWFISAGLLWQSWRRATSSAHRTLILGLTGSLVAGWMFGMLDAISLGSRPGFIWWLLLALVVAVRDAVTADVFDAATADVFDAATADVFDAATADARAAATQAPAARAATRSAAVSPAGGAE